MPAAVAMRMTMLVTVVVRMPVVVAMPVIVPVPVIVPMVVVVVVPLVPRRCARALARVLAAASASLCVLVHALRAATVRRAALLLSLVSHCLGPMDCR